MTNIVEDFVYSRKNLMEYFKCNNDYFIKPFFGYKWRVKENDGLYFLVYWKDGEGLNERVITKMNNNPAIIRKEEFTMVVFIECVKVAAILENINEV